MEPDSFVDVDRSRIVIPDTKLDPVQAKGSGMFDHQEEERLAHALFVVFIDNADAQHGYGILISDTVDPAIADDALVRRRAVEYDQGTMVIRMGLSCERMGVI